MLNERKTFLSGVLENLRKEIKERVEARRTEIKASADRRGSRFDSEDSSDNFSDDMEFALVQMDEVNLRKVEEALGRLKQGTYGFCLECGSEIAERRLRALPFAMRCRDCEEAREVREMRERALAERRTSGSLFLDMRS